MTSPAGRTVLVTGATGYIASQLLPTFRERYDLRLIDVRDTDRHGQSVPGAQIVDLATADDAVVRPLFTGADAVVHLAYHRPENANLNDQTGFMTRGYLGERENVQARVGAPRPIEARTFFPNGPGTDGDAVQIRTYLVEPARQG